MAHPSITIAALWHSANGEWSGAEVVSDHEAQLLAVGVALRKTRPYRPQTNGKDVHLCQAASRARSGLNSVPA